MTTAAQKRANLTAIRRTIEEFSPGGDAAGLHAFAVRESGLNHYVPSRHPADRNGAIKAFARNRQKFADAGNPWVSDPELWYKSLGLFQHMIPNHLQRWDAAAHPNVLRHPVVATVVAARLWNRAVQLGAKNLCDLRSLWARGHLGGDPSYAKRCASTRNRLKTLGYPDDTADRSLEGFGLQGFGRAPTGDQLAKFQRVAESLGLPTDPAAAPEHWSLSGDSPTTPAPGRPPGRPEIPSGADPLVAAVGLGGIAVVLALALRGRRR